jgi:hypothetical protein
MPFPTTGSVTELQAVNQILASVGQAPVNTLTSEEIIVLNEINRFTGYISGTTLTTETAGIEAGTYISGIGVAANTSIATEGVEVSPATDPVTYEYTVNISQTVGDSSNYIELARAIVTKKVETQTNPDVAIAYNTLLEVSREVQAEGWTFNREFQYELVPDSNNEIIYPNNVLQIDLSQEVLANRNKSAVRRTGKLYDRINHTFKWTDSPVYCDIVWLFDWLDLPRPIQDYITARASAIVCSRILGDANQYQILQQKEAYTRAMALEYECNQGNFTFFGKPVGGTYYNSYQPFHTLQR